MVSGLKRPAIKENDERYIIEDRQDAKVKDRERRNLRIVMLREGLMS